MTTTEPRPPSATLEGPAAADLYRCVHCGFCLPNCPTYVETGLETASPRGRLALMKAVHEGRLDLTPRVEEHLELCVQCRACEAVCPSGVPFGRIMEAARAQLNSARPMPRRERLARFAGLRVLLASPSLLRAFAWGLKGYQRSGLQWLARTFGLLSLAPGLDRIERQLPRLGRFYTPRDRVPRGGKAKQGRAVAVLNGCVMPLVYGRVHEATERVLARNGCAIVQADGQACCGALHAHAGDLATARNLARRNIEAFEAARPDAVVVNAAGCGAAMKEYGDLLKDDPVYAGRARVFSAQVKDVNEYLASLPLEPPAAGLDVTVTYQDSCHLAQAQRIKAAPRQVLGSIPGLRLSELRGSELCCGAGGLYSLTNNAMSMQLLDHKMEHAAATGAEVIATANPGCMMQLETGARRSGSAARVVHVVELLDEAYRRESGLGRPTST
jgi:glycolate oxidase iron-sulfur subunit